MPTITSVYPQNQATGVVLGSGISITFDSLMNHATITPQSFALIAPAGTMIITPSQEIQQNPRPISGSQNVPGTFSFSDTSGVTAVIFTPSVPLQVNTTYTIIIIGTSAMLVANPVTDVNGTPLANNYSWTFTTGTLDLVTPPFSSPLPPNNPEIDPKTDIIVSPRMWPAPNGQDLTQEIDIIFPADIDPNSFDINDLLLSIDPVLGDPSVVVPPGLLCTATISGNIIKLIITGWSS